MEQVTTVLILQYNNGDPEVLVTNISIPSRSRIAISTLLMKFNLYGLVIAWTEEAHAKMHLGVLMCMCESKQW